MTRWIEAAHQLTPTGGWRGVTIATLLGLLWVTGMRIGEALSLDVGAFDRKSGILTVERGKFGKRRLLPLRTSSAGALARYLDHSLRPMAATPAAPVFVSIRRRRLSKPAASDGVIKAVGAAQIKPPLPRAHDLRHSFAVRHVVACYAEGGDVQALLPTLSTYLGHVSVESTRQYLVANGSILQQAAQRFATGTAVLDEVAS